MERIISQAGDSTDGEDFEIKLGTDNFVEEKLNQRHNSGNCTIFFQGEDGKEFFNISTSCILRIIGYELLQSAEVRNEYKKIKASFIPEDLEIECKELDKLLGRKWSEIVMNNVNRIDRSYGDRCNDIYQILKEDLGKFFRESVIFSEFCSVNAEVQAEYNEIKNLFSSEQNRSKSVEKLLNRIKFVHRKIEEFNRMRRRITEFLILEPDKTETNACASLARLKARLKLDRDLEKNYICNFRMPGLTETLETRFYIQSNEFLTISLYGTFQYYKTICSSYKIEGERLLELEEYKKINKNEIKNFLKKVLRGNLDKSILTDENDKETLDRLKNFVELMFGIESKRNFAALLNNAMFLDLVHANAESYAINKISEKMPMAMQGAVRATAVIDNHVDRRYLTDYPPQYLTDNPNNNVLELARREQQITQDWIKFKLNKTDDQDFEANVPAKIFNELILDWYGIELPFLKKGMIKFEPLSHRVEKKLEKPQITNEISIDKEKAESINSANTFKDTPSNEESPEKEIKEDREVLVKVELKNLENNKHPQVETEKPVNFLPNNESSVKILEAATIKNCENDFNHNVIVVENLDKKQEGKNIAKKRSGPESCAQIMSPVDSPKKLAVDNLSSIDQDEIDKNREKIVLSLTF